MEAASTNHRVADAISTGELSWTMKRMGSAPMTAGPTREATPPTAIRIDPRPAAMRSAAKGWELQLIVTSAHHADRHAGASQERSEIPQGLPPLPGRLGCRI